TNNQSVLHIFGDTTLELPLTYKYVEEFKLANPSTPFFDEKNEENDFFDMCKEIGPPSRVMAWCCSVFKTGPMGTTLSNFEEDFLTFYGVRRKESNSRSKYPRILKSTKIDKQLSIGPIIDWLDIDVWLYILSEAIEFNESYRQGDSRVGCWVCPHKGNWSDFTAKIYNNNSYKKWENFLMEFAKGIGKTDYEEYVKTEKWKLRRGGEGLERTKTSAIQKQECINEKNTHIINLSRNVNEEFITLFKPFGKFNFRIQGNSQEMLVISPKGKGMFKITFKIGEKEIRITLIDLEDKHLYSKIKKQINKFNNCIYCQACNATCSFGALSVINGKYNIDENKCVHCKNCIDKFSAGCLVAAALSTKK
ncbi:MAG: phosphoadenosine phosphosulfate reductase family protein, partial [Cetobacterium sp.]